MEQTEHIEIGKIVSAVGLRGEVKIYPYSDRQKHFAQGAKFLVGGRPVCVETARFVKKLPILKFVGTESRDEADALRGQTLSVSALTLEPLPDGEWYVRDLIGCDVQDETGRRLGSIADVIQNGAQDIYEIAMPDGRKFLLPAAAAYVIHVDIPAKRVTVHAPDSLLELAL
ncbi:MAG: ribosome maturation factor RimM [Clostridiales Family XIII bacterium]|jgi:16S rRNA processing protein RimM|nr:ribosome maturation factor RimM [Clostridiales Family XIII bacterium]